MSFPTWLCSSSDKNKLGKSFDYFDVAQHKCDQDRRGKPNAQHRIRKRFAILFKYWTPDQVRGDNAFFLSVPNRPTFWPVVEGAVWADVCIESSPCREHKTDKRIGVNLWNPCLKTKSSRIPPLCAFAPLSLRVLCVLCGRVNFRQKTRKGKFLTVPSGSCRIIGPKGKGL
jgi:hypothetical protein